MFLIGRLLFRTLTTPVELIKCLKSIKEYAFVASEYPVVITLEDHLTPNLQAKVAEVNSLGFCALSSPFCLCICILRPYNFLNCCRWLQIHSETFCSLLALNA